MIGPPPIFPVIGNVLDRSTCPPGHWVTDGQFLYPSVFANPTVPCNPPAAAGFPFGASFSGEPVLMPGRCGSSCNPFPVITTNEPIVGGKNLVFNLSGAPPGTSAIFALDFVCTTGFGIGPGCFWWLPLSFAWPITVEHDHERLRDGERGTLRAASRDLPRLRRRDRLRAVGLHR